jgi:hypothetical protein
LKTVLSSLLFASPPPVGNDVVVDVLVLLAATASLVVIVPATVWTVRWRLRHQVNAPHSVIALRKFYVANVLLLLLALSLVWILVSWLRLLL